MALLIAPAIVTMSVGDDANPLLRWSIALVSAAIIVGAVWVSKRRGLAIAEDSTHDVAAP